MSIAPRKNSTMMSTFKNASDFQTYLIQESFGKRASGNVEQLAYENDQPSWATGTVGALEKKGLVCL